MARVEGVFIGGPKKLQDERGTWMSSIYREPAGGPVEISLTGLPGDRVTQPYHGGLDAALCVHLTDHYEFWKTHYGVDLSPGSVGENITLSGLTEDEVCAGDTARLGSAVVQVSSPRIPCANQGRRVGRRDWVKLTVRENRCGFYLRVLEPGVVQFGDSYSLLKRTNPDGALTAINRCLYLDFDAEFASRIMCMEGLTSWWREQITERLGDKEQHWSAQMKL